MKTKEIRDLIDFISQSGLNEVIIETDELKLSIKRNPETQVIESHNTPIAAVPVPASPAPVTVENTAQTTSPEDQATATSDIEKYIEIKSPMIGTFFRSPNPESGPFLSVGDTVEAGQTVCIVEAMKLFNEIESEISGKVIKVLVEDTTPVEYDQPLFLVDPS